MHISIVIPNYNGFAIITKNLPTLFDVLQKHLENNSDSFQIVIVDDGSRDESVSFLEKFAREATNKIAVDLVVNQINQGFSTTVNRGVGKATGEIVILLNTDVIPHKGFIKPLLNHFDIDSVFAVGCMDKSIEGDKEVLRGRGLGKWEKGFLKHYKADVSYSSTLWVSGGSGAFRRKYWERLGGLNELMNPFYWEDIDLSYRAQKAGFTILFEKESIVTHKHEEGAIKKQHTSKKVRVTSYRNQYIFAWTNMSDRLLILSHILWQPYHLFRAILKKDASLLAGFFQALILLPAILERRNEVQKDVVVSDRRVIRRLSGLS